MGLGRLCCNRTEIRQWFASRWATALGTVLLFLLAPALLRGDPDPLGGHLAGLARAWGHVKYVHPGMAMRAIDWDGALVRAIPAVEAARSDQQYRAAIARMLSELGDPVTRVLEPEVPAELPAPKAELTRQRLEKIGDKTALIVAHNDPSLASIPDLTQEMCTIFDQAEAFDRVVLDFRSLTGLNPGWPVQNAIYKCLSRLLDRDVSFPPARFLEHGFYWFQSITGGAGGGPGGSSHLAVSSRGVMRGEGRRVPKLAVIVNAGTADIYDALMGLQAYGLAQVIQQGELRNAGVFVKSFEVEPGLTIAIRHAELVRPDGSAGFVPDRIVGIASDKAADPAHTAALRALRGSNRRVRADPGMVSSPVRYSAFIENGYSDTRYPDRAHRLLALFRLWNVIEYFFPYKDLMDRPWRDVLVEFIPRMRDARDETEYALAVAELATRIQDSHVTLQSPVLDAYFGTHRPALRVDLVEGQTVITEVAPEQVGSGVRAGDIVLSVDGEASGARRARLARYLPASTAGRLENKIDIQFLLGPKSQPAILEVRGENGSIRRATLPRTLEGLAPRARRRTGRVCTVLPEGYGYVDLERLESKEVDAAFENIRNTPALILDMRGYPNAAFAFVGRLGRGTPRPAGMWGTPKYDGASGTFSVEESVASPITAQGPGYSGRVVVLADGSTQSAAEYVCMLIKTGSKAIFVGTRTSGANGGVTRTILPGGIVVNFTGYSARYADGSQFQRIGIIPDIEVRPTLRGIREGRDELLERAVEVLRAS